MSRKVVTVNKNLSIKDLSKLFIENRFNGILQPTKSQPYQANPLCYMVGMRGFEPPTTRPPAEYATRLRYIPDFNDFGVCCEVLACYLTTSPDIFQVS